MVCLCGGLPAIGAGPVLICSHCFPRGLLDCGTIAAFLLVTGALGSLKMIGPECADVWRPLPTLVELMRPGQALDIGLSACFADAWNAK
jgi:hypothetical protein